MYEQFRNIQLEIADDNPESVIVRDLDTGAEISKNEGADALLAIADSGIEADVRIRMQDRAVWLWVLNAKENP